MKKKYLIKKSFFLALLLLNIFSIKAQIIITPGTGITPQQLVQNILVGNGVTVSNVTFNGLAGPTASNQIGSFVSIGVTNLGIQSGLLLSSGGVSGMGGLNNSPSTTTTITGTSLQNDPQLSLLVPGATLNDCAVLEFDFIPISDTIKFKFIFGSEEYPEFVNTSYNDVFGFFISGANPNGPSYVNKNIALIPNTTMPITIDNVNVSSNSQYFVTNTSSSLIQFDGFTTVLTAIAVVVPCTQYHLKLAVADRSDYSYDSGVFLEANSLSSNAISVTTTYSSPTAIPMAIECCNNAIVKFKIPNAKSDTSWFPLLISGTAINGVDYQQIPNIIYIAPGQTTKILDIIPICDNITEPIEFIKIKIDDTLSCTNFLDSVYIELLSYIPISISAITDTMICQDLNLTAAAQLEVYPTSGISPYTIVWQPAADLNNPNIANPLARPAIGNHTNFLVEVSDSTHCPGDTASVFITVNEAPQMSFSPMPYPAMGCSPLEVVFTDFTTPTIQIYNWSFGDGGSDTAQNPTHIYSQVGSYTVSLKVVSVDGCKGETNLPNVVNVYPNPVALFTATPPIAPISNALISFNSSASSPGVTSWTWNFGDPTSLENNSILPNPSHGYYSNGLFTVWLKVSTSHNCMDSTSFSVRIIEDSLVFPNIITPNGDGINDFFDIPNLENYVSSKLQIYNRWGKKVYEKEPYIPKIDKWDGETLPDGTYFYNLKFKGYLQEGEQKGSITILR